MCCIIRCHGGCSVSMNRWKNVAGSIDGLLRITWSVPYKRVYPRLKARDAINASIPMHGEVCMPQVAALRISLQVPVWNEWTEWLWYVSFECERRTDRRSLSWMRLRANWCMISFGGHCKASAVCDQKQSKRSFPYGIPLGVLRHRVVSSPAHEEARFMWA